MQDFEPYFCTVADCKAPFNVPNSFDGLLNHMQGHVPEAQPTSSPVRSGPQQPKADDEGSTGNLPKNAPAQIEFDVKEAERMNPARKGPFLFDECPFCGGYPDVVEKEFPDRDTIDAQISLRKHVQKHMREIALFLPPCRFDTLSEYGEDTYNSNDTHRRSSVDNLSEDLTAPSMVCRRESCDCKVAGEFSSEETELELLPNSSPAKEDRWVCCKCGNNYGWKEKQSCATLHDFHQPQTCRTCYKYEFDSRTVGEWGLLLEGSPLAVIYQAQDADNIESGSARRSSKGDADENPNETVSDCGDEHNNKDEFGDKDESGLAHHIVPYIKVTPSNFPHDSDQRSSMSDEYGDDNNMADVDEYEDTYGQDPDEQHREDYGELDNLLRRCAIQHYDRSTRFFWTNKLLERILTRKRVMEELEAYQKADPALFNGTTIAACADNIMETHLKVFAILVLLDKGPCIRDVMATLKDTDLPLSTNNSKSCRLYRHSRKTSKLQLVACLSRPDWKTLHREAFLKLQHALSPQYLDLEEDRRTPKHSDFGYETVLPFIHEEERQQGAYGVVTKVTIHPDCHGFHDVVKSVCSLLLPF
jgi:hypothetical protein